MSDQFPSCGKRARSARTRSKWSRCRQTGRKRQRPEACCCKLNTQAAERVSSSDDRPICSDGQIPARSSAFDHCTTNELRRLASHRECARGRCIAQEFPKRQSGHGGKLRLAADNRCETNSHGSSAKQAFGGRGVQLLRQRRRKHLTHARTDRTNKTMRQDAAFFQPLKMRRSETQ